MEKINVKNLSSEEAASVIENKYPHLRVVDIESDNGLYARKGLIGFDSYEEAKSILDSLDLKLFCQVSVLRTQNGHRYENYNPYKYEDIDVYQCMIEDHVEGLFCYKEDVLDDYRYILEEEEDPDIEEKVNSLKQKLDAEDFDKYFYRSFGDYDDYEMIEKYDRISERWLRITRAIKNAAEQAEDRKVAKYYVIK